VGEARFLKGREPEYLRKSRKSNGVLQNRGDVPINKTEIPQFGMVLTLGKVSAVN